ncbi:MAG: high frequency lysogenization protein [Gammaproteobacteria bacterium]|jgi:high frequency lysogenization protein
MNSLHNQGIALAGMFQAATLIDDIAHRGQCPSEIFEPCFDSLFEFEASSGIEIFGNLSNISFGLQEALNFLTGNRTQQTATIPYYLFSALKLSDQIISNASIRDEITRELRQVAEQTESFELPLSNCISKVGGLYQKIISPLSPRIIVKGNPNYLTNENNAARVRALILCVIRSAVLWKQSGGSKWRILFFRKKLSNIIQELLNEAQLPNSQ